jgi:hypothetical protein
MTGNCCASAVAVRYETAKENFRSNISVRPRRERTPEMATSPNSAEHLVEKRDVICPDCPAGYRRTELESKRGLVCDRILEVFDGSREKCFD